MILARLVVAGDPPIALDLPAGLSVVVGLGPAGRSRVAETFARLLAGDGEGVEATVLVDGAEFEVEPDLADLLELAAPPERVVFSAPSGAAAPPSEPAVDVHANDAEVDRLQTRLDELSATRASLANDETASVAADERRGDERLDEIAARRVDLEDRRREATERLAAQIDEAARKADADERMHRLEAELERQSVRLEALAAARQAAATSAVFDETDGTGDDELVAVEAQLAQLAERWDELAAENVTVPDPVAVEAALEAFRFIRSWTPEPLAEASNLADRLADLRERRSSQPASKVPDWLRAQTLEQLEEARAAVAAAEPEQPAELVDPDKAAALEEAHAAVDEAKDRAGRRFATPLVRRRLAAAQAAERSLLDELGFSSYSSYLLGRASGRANDAEAERKLAAAKAALADAEAVWAEIEGQGDWAWPGTDNEEEALRTQARALVGPILVEEAADAEALERLLREYRTPAPEWRPAAVAVVKALAEASVDVDQFDAELGDQDADRVDVFASAWLEETRVRITRAAEVTQELRRLSAQRTVLERRRRQEQLRADALRGEQDELASEQAQVEAEIASLTDQLDRIRAEGMGEVQPAPAPAEGDAEAQLAEIDAELTELSDRVADIEAEIDAAESARREAERSALAARLAALDDEATEVAAALERLTLRESGGPAGDDSAGDDSAANQAMIELVQDWLAKAPNTSEAGPLPVLLHDALEGQPESLVERVLTLLLDASAERQIVYLTDSDVVLSWAAGAGDAVALVRSVA